MCSLEFKEIINFCFKSNCYVFSNYEDIKIERNHETVKYNLLILFMITRYQSHSDNYESHY